jgi:lipopolysaccharide/colanic/teichoic acid biosynthesis glycosyltransferase
MYYKYLKRLLDILLALTLLPFVLIAIITIAPLIYWNDRGSIFYNAIRAGKNYTRFTMYKFRSMKINAPDIRNADGSTFNSDNDPRVTSIGRILRKMSIDELPQLINVLKGDMSFVGPRPTLANMPVSELSDVQLKRYQVRPGITGYSQAYFRNSISQEEKFINDCYYVDNMSFRLDIKIMWQTFYSVLKQKNINIQTGNE